MLCAGPIEVIGGITYITPYYLYGWPLGFLVCYGTPLHYQHTECSMNRDTLTHLPLVDLPPHVVDDASEDVSEQAICPLPGVGVHAAVQVVLAY